MTSPPPLVRERPPGYGPPGMPRRQHRAALAALVLAAAAAGCAAEKEAFREVAPPELFLEVLPRGALLELDGVGVGRGSRAIPAPEPGEHVLVASADGFEALERTLPPGQLDGVRVGVALRPEGFGAARRLDLDDAAGLAAAAMVLGRAGRHRDAHDYAARAAALDARHAPAQRALGDALAALGKRNEARAAWGRYLLLAPDAPDAAEVERRMGEGRATFEVPAGR
jgi:tetratricopeptide (TPR) repeat protein